MKKLVAVLLIAVSSVSYGQMAEIGYNTMDIGGDFQWYKDGKFLGFHAAINAKLHHSFHGAVGYYMAGNPTAPFYTNQNKGGLGLGIGYRYYVLYKPHGFFIGVNTHLFTNKITLTAQTAESYNSMIFIPSMQLGYMLLINDMFFITPVASAGYKTNLQNSMKTDKKKAVALLGISSGIKF